MRIKWLNFLIISFLGVASSGWTKTDALMDPKIVLEAAVKEYVSNSLEISTDQVRLRPLHRSFSPPLCAENFEISFFEKSENSLLVECKSAKWRSYISINITEIRDIPVYVESFERGHPLTSKELILERMEGNFSNSILDRENLGLVVLRRPVKPGQIALTSDVEKAVVAHKLIRDVEAKSKLTTSSIKKIIIAESRANENQIFPTRLIKGSIAARQLRAGRILSRIDFNERKRALFVTENIRYGGLVDNTNTEMRTTNDKLPKNSVLDLSALGRVQAVRLLRSDTLLRHSDVRPAPLVRSGEATTLSIKKGSLNIAVTLIALENGLMGELITLKNPDSGENLVARVAGVGKVTLPN